MNIAEEILAPYSTEHAIKVAAYACSSKANFKILMDCFASDDNRLSQRAAWCVNWAAQKKPAMMVPYINLLVTRLQDSKANDSVLRNALRVLRSMDIPEDYHGTIMDCCFKFIEEPKTAIAVKAFSLHLLHQLSKIYPEILPELKLVIEDKWDNETAAFKSVARKILKPSKK